jgi:hypothetical protein
LAARKRSNQSGRQSAVGKYFHALLLGMDERSIALQPVSEQCICGANHRPIPAQPPSRSAVQTAQSNPSSWCADCFIHNDRGPSEGSTIFSSEIPAVLVLLVDRGTRQPSQDRCQRPCRGNGRHGRGDCTFIFEDDRRRSAGDRRLPQGPRARAGNRPVGTRSLGCAHGGGAGDLQGQLRRLPHCWRDREARACFRGLCKATLCNLMILRRSFGSSWGDRRVWPRQARLRRPRCRASAGASMTRRWPRR